MRKFANLTPVSPVSKHIHCDDILTCCVPIDSYVIGSFYRFLVTLLPKLSISDDILHSLLILLGGILGSLGCKQFWLSLDGCNLNHHSSNIILLFNYEFIVII